MTPPENEIASFLKEYIWPLIVVIGGVAGAFGKWLWQHNEKEHEALRKLIDEQQKEHRRLKEQSSQGQSTLNDRLMEHVDNRVDDAIKFARDEDTRLMLELTTQRGHIAKIFDKLEEHARRSEDRHLEMLNAIHEGLARKADK